MLNKYMLNEWIERTNSKNSRGEKGMGKNYGTKYATIYFFKYKYIENVWKYAWICLYYL